MLKKEKRSETIEVRIGYDAKRRFMEICQQTGFTASDVLRGAIAIFVSICGAFQAMKSALSRRKMMVSGVALAATLAISFSAAQPFFDAHKMPDNLATFQQIDADRKGYFVLADFFVYSGMTSKGTISDQKRSETKAAFWAELGAYGDTIAWDRASPEFIEGVISNAEKTTAESLKILFREIDSDQDGMITPREFLISKA